jgi:hypothetical protein
MAKNIYPSTERDNIIGHFKLQTFLCSHTYNIKDSNQNDRSISSHNIVDPRLRSGLLNINLKDNLY